MSYMNINPLQDDKISPLSKSKGFTEGKFNVTKNIEFSFIQ